MSSVVDKDT